VTPEVAPEWPEVAPGGARGSARVARGSARPLILFIWINGSPAGHGAETPLLAPCTSSKAQPRRYN